MNIWKINKVYFVAGVISVVLIVIAIILMRRKKVNYNLIKVNFIDYETGIAQIQVGNIKVDFSNDIYDSGEMNIADSNGKESDYSYRIITTHFEDRDYTEKTTKITLSNLGEPISEKIIDWNLMVVADTL